MAVIGYLGSVMEKTLVLLYNLTGSYGISIIMLTLLIRLVLLPLTLSQTKSMAVMKELQPKMKALQEKYKDKPQEYQQKVMQLYKDNNFNPLSGCLPLLVQLPFLWALFGVLREFPKESLLSAFNQPFSAQFLLWDLSVKDPFYVMPIISGLTTYWQMSQTSTDPSQKSMLILMPIFITWISVSFPAGLVLYWTVSNLFSIGQQYWITRQTELRRGGSEAR